MKIYFIAVVSVCFIWVSIAPVRASIYEWVDDQGVIHFTDNADHIPAKYLKKAKERKSLDGAVIITPSTGSASGPKDGGSGAPVASGRLDEGEWRSRFKGIRQQIKRLEDGLVAKRETLNTLRRKKAVYGRGSDRTAVNDQSNDIARDEAEIKELEQKLADLDVEAAKAGVPLEWRK